MAPKLATHLGHLVKDRAGMMGKRLAGLCERHAASAAMEQYDFARSLHGPESFTGGGQRKTDLDGAMGDAARVDNCDKKAKVGEIKAHEARLVANATSA